MTESAITVTYERKLSDGNYGSEGLSMTITMPIEHAALGDGVLKRYARDLRTEVLSELAQSAAPGVAGAAAHELNPPPPRSLQPVVAGESEYEEQRF